MQQKIYFKGFAKKEAELAEIKLEQLAKQKGMTKQEYIEWSVDKFLYMVKKEMKKDKEKFNEKHFNYSWDHIIKNENL